MSDKPVVDSGMNNVDPDHSQENAITQNGAVIEPDPARSVIIPHAPTVSTGQALEKSLSDGLELGESKLDAVIGKGAVVESPDIAGGYGVVNGVGAVIGEGGSAELRLDGVAGSFDSDDVSSDKPPLSQNHALVPNSLSSGTPTLGTPSLSQVHSLSDTSVTSGKVSDTGATSEHADAVLRQSGTQFDIRRDSTDEEICLNTNEYGRALAAFFENSGDDLCFGLFGPWGRGKTTLMKKTSELLTAKNYCTVEFSAWKYRTSPEIWVYLFQQFAIRCWQANWRIPIRAVFSRKEGYYHLIIALIVCLMSAIPMMEKLQFIEPIVRAIGGLSMIVYLGFVVASFYSQALRLIRLFSIHGHTAKLGLQAAIGDDLRALLETWVPVTDSFSIGRWCYWAFPYLLYSFAVCLIFWNLGNSIPPLVCSVVALTIVCLPCLVFWPFNRYKTQRILLVVDDLDRCNIRQMLEIIESIMLLLDDPSIKKRVQIAMLVEESSVRSSLLRKYKHMWKDDTDCQDRIVRENMEKLFLAHLRLGELGNSEIAELMGRFIRQKNANFSPVPPVKQPSESASSLTGNVATQNKEVDRIRRELVWTEADEKILLELAPKFGNSNYRGRWGPRAVRCFLNRYQMARAILKSRDIQFTPRDLAEALLKVNHDRHDSVDTASVEYVAWQVS